MSGDWQTWAALGVVAITVVLFVVRAVRKRRKAAAGCVNSADCGCGGARPGKLRPGDERR